MQHIFLNPDKFVGDEAIIDGADHQHLAKVMRARSGDKIVLLDNRGGVFCGTLLAVEKRCTTVRVESECPQLAAKEPGVWVTIAQALAKGDKFEQVVQHGTEAGAAEFVPIRADKCVVDMPADMSRAADRIARWNLIAKNAAEQSFRSRIPPVLSPIKSSYLFGDQPVSGVELRLVLHPGAGSEPLRCVLDEADDVIPTRIVVAIGPEGGWSDEELAAARESGWRAVAVGPRVLRTETAALITLGQIMYRFEV